MVDPLRVGIANPVEGFDPHEAIDYAAGMIQLQLFETPYRLENGERIPHLLREFTPHGARSRDWSARVDPAHVFSDGTPLTPQIVVDSFRRCGRLGAGAAIRIEDDRIHVTGSTLRARPLDFLVSPYASIVLPRDDVLLGTGPYRVADGSDPARVRLEANPHHAGPPPAIDTIEFIAFDDEQSLSDAATAGRIDFTSALSPTAVESVRRARKQTVAGPSTALLWIHTERVPDRRVRRAIALGLDRAALTRASFTNPGAFFATSVVPRVLAEWDDELRPDPPRARELLAEANAVGPIPLKLLLVWSPRMYLPQPRESAAMVAEQLGHVGFEVQVVESTSPTDYLETLARGDFDLVLGGWTADEVSIPVFLDALFSSASVPTADGRMPGCNFGRWRDAETDSLLDSVHEGEDTAIGKLVQHLATESPVVALHHGCVALVLGERIRGREFDALGYPLLASFTLGPPRR